MQDVLVLLWLIKHSSCQKKLHSSLLYSGTPLNSRFLQWPVNASEEADPNHAASISILHCGFGALGNTSSTFKHDKLNYCLNVLVLVMSLPEYIDPESCDFSKCFALCAF